MQFDTFSKIGKNVSKRVRSAPFFFTPCPIIAQVEVAHKNEPNRTKIDNLVTETMFGDRKS